MPRVETELSRMRDKIMKERGCTRTTAYRLIRQGERRGGEIPAQGENATFIYEEHVSKGEWV